MTAFGLNIDRSGTDMDRVLTLGGTLTRLPYHRDHDVAELVGRLNGAGVATYWVFDGPSFTAHGPIETWDEREAAAAMAAGDWRQKYGHLDPNFQRIQWGNEPTGHGPSSWQMPLQEVSEWLFLARHNLEEYWLVAPGIDDGDPVTLAELDAHDHCLDWVNAVALQVYGRYAESWPYPSWYWGSVLGLLNDQRKMLDCIGRTDKRMIVSEIGWNIGDFWDQDAYGLPPRSPEEVQRRVRAQGGQRRIRRGAGSPEAREAQARACETVLSELASSDLVDDVIVYCCDSWANPPFALCDDEGLLPVGQAFRRVARGEGPMW